MQQPVEVVVERKHHRVDLLADADRSRWATGEAGRIRIGERHVVTAEAVMVVFDADRPIATEGVTEPHACGPAGMGVVAGRVAGNKRGSAEAQRPRRTPRGDVSNIIAAVLPGDAA